MRRVLLAGLAAGTVAMVVPGSLAGASTRDTQAGPAAKAAENFPPSAYPCPRGSLVGRASSGRDQHLTVGVNSGPRYFFVTWGASTRTCRGQTQVVYTFSWDFSTLPDNRYVIFQFQSQRSDGRWSTSCVRNYENKRMCSFKIDGGTKGPQCCASRPREQFRFTPGNYYVSKVRLLGLPFQDDTGTLPASTQYNRTLKLRFHRTRKATEH